MQSRWRQEGAERALKRWAKAHGEAFALRVYTARLLGRDPTLALHGGGNVSVKGTNRNLLGDDVDVMYVKASGGNLADCRPGDLPGVALDHLRCLRSLESLTDEQLLNELRRPLIDPTAPTPSIETLLHAFLPHPFVDHSHADPVLTLACQPDAEAVAREAFGRRVAVVPYVRPGLELARAAADTWERHPDIEAIVLLHHGLITFGDDARTTYERHIDLVNAAERFIDQRLRRAASISLPDRSSHGATRGADRPVQERAALIAPILRGLLARPTGDDDRPYQPAILEWRATNEILRVLEHPDAEDVLTAGPLTGDPIIYTKPKPLWVAALDGSSPTALCRQLKARIEAYQQDYIHYINQHGGAAPATDPSPRVVLCPGLGMFCAAKTKYTARITADLAERAFITQLQAQSFGRCTPLPREHWYDMEFRAMQRRKLGTLPDRLLEGRVVAISGGAGAIGAAVAEVCAEHGAHVVIADVNQERSARVVERVTGRCGKGSALCVSMDVTDETSVAEGFEHVARNYGGVDVVVANAGIGHVAPIDRMEVADFRRVMEVNAAGCFLFVREAVRVLKTQGIGGDIIIMASKNVFAPGKAFSAYSASKAAAHQLGKVAAIELAPFGIRVNMINPDAIFGEEGSPSVLWADVGPLRAAAHGLSPEELPEYYRKRNLLQARISGRHVGHAVVFFASHRTPTTGATLPIDGGIVEAFPR